MSLPPAANAVPFDQASLEQLATAIADPGYGIFPDFLPPSFASELIALIEGKIAADAMVRAGVGKVVKVHSEIRTDSIFWLDPADSSPTTQIWLESMNLLNAHFRESMFLPLWNYEGHLARYPASGFYKAHLDQHQHSLARQISIVTYLNEAWDESDGGQLRLFTDPKLGTSGPFVDVIPRLGTVVIFRSADFWHEVLPAKQARLSLTGWLRGRDDVLV